MASIIKSRLELPVIAAYNNLLEAVPKKPFPREEFSKILATVNERIDSLRAAILDPSFDRSKQYQVENSCSQELEDFFCRVTTLEATDILKNLEEAAHFITFPIKIGSYFYAEHLKSGGVTEKKHLPSKTLEIFHAYVCGHRMKKEKSLGQGGFGSVTKTVLKTSVFACKESKAYEDPESSKNSIEANEKEAYLYLYVNHPNVIQLLGLTQNPLQLYLEYASEGSLWDLLNRQTTLPNNFRVLMPGLRDKFSVQIADALRYLHEHFIVHDDVKPGNILVDERYNFKLTDLGLARYSKDKRRGGTTRGFNAPEILQGDNTSEKADTWAFGVTLYTTFRNAIVYYKKNISQTWSKYEDALLSDYYNKPADEAALFEKIHQSQWEEYDPTGRFRGIIARCLDGRVEERPTMKDIHTYLSLEEAMQVVMKKNPVTPKPLAVAYKELLEAVPKKPFPIEDSPKILEDVDKKIACFRVSISSDVPETEIAVSEDPEIADQVRNFMEVIKLEKKKGVQYLEERLRTAKTFITSALRITLDDYRRYLELEDSQIMRSLPSKTLEVFHAYICGARKEQLGFLGTGGYGSVFKRALGKLSEFACKEPIKGELSDNSIKEACIYSLLDHPRIMKLFAFSDNPSRLYFEYAAKGSLQNLINAQLTLHSNFRLIGPSLRRRFFLELAGAVDYLHEKGFIHGDIKPDNIFIDGNDHIKLGDLGSVRYSKGKKEVVTTPGYVAPEMLNKDKPSEALDAWAFGVTLYQTFQKYHPYYTQHQSCSDYTDSILKERYNKPADVAVIFKDTEDWNLYDPGEVFRTIIKGCLDGRSGERPTMRWIQSHLSTDSLSKDLALCRINEVS